MNRFFLYFVKITGYLPAKVFFKWKIYYENKQVQTTAVHKGAMIVSNHKAIMDVPFYTILFFKTPVRFLVADVVYDTNVKIVSHMLNRMGCLRVDRATMDFSFIDESVKALLQGDRICIFPEGQLPREGKMSRFTPSYVMIALQSGADIIPVYTDGCYGMTKRAHVTIGEPINLKAICDKEYPSKEDIQMCNDIVLNKIKELGKETERKKAKV